MDSAASGSGGSKERVATSNPWWLRLPAPNNPDENYKEPNPKAKGRRRRGTEIPLWDKRTMVAYLIVKSQIGNGTSREPWCQMHKDGYMRGRSIEALNNNYRRVILPKIEKLGLPKDIEKEFVEARKLYESSSRSKK